MEPKSSLSDDPRPLPPSGGQRGKSPRGLVFKLAALVLSLLIASGLAEVGLRLFFRRDFAVFQDERDLMYRYDKALGWFPIPLSRCYLCASRPITIEHNSEGFRGPERAQNEKPTVVFLGDSFVWGYDVEAAERFTDKLQLRHPEWNIYNFGVSGYGTDQEYLLLQQHFDAYKPRVVFLMFCVETDHDDNSSNMRYGGYYKPYCTITGTHLQLNGVPVPRGERAWIVDHQFLAHSFLMRLLVRARLKLTAPKVLHNPDPTGALIRDLQKYVQSKGAVFVMGLTKANPRLEEFLQFFKIPYVDLSTSLRYPAFGNHWTPEGHTFVCDKIEQFLLKQNF